MLTMLPYRSGCFVLSWIVTVSIADSIRDFGSQPTQIETSRLPYLSEGTNLDTTAIPALANGHIATIVYNDTIHMNGIYNGRMSKSHRARIPAEINLRVRFQSMDSTRQVYRQYRLDMKNGFWEENITMEECRVTQRVYTHQFYTRLLVTEIIAQRQGSATGNLLVYLDGNRGKDSDDITFTQPMSFSGGNWRSQGTTKESEISGGHKSNIYTYWSIVPPIIHIPSYQKHIRYTYIMSIDTNQQVAEDSFVSGSWMADRNPEKFFSLHTDSWRKRWEGGGVDISGDPRLEKLAYSSYYHILSSLPSLYKHKQSNPFGGISSGGLADRAGHVSWDQERWILPAVLPFYPSLARDLIDYRINTGPAARTQAANEGRSGAMYSWKSAATGADVTPQHQPSNHYHLNGDISWAVRQYISTTRDRLWMQEKGACSLVNNLASFWYSKLTWNSSTNHFDIKGVASPDDSKGSVDNSLYTNAVASLALHYSKYAACVCNIDVNTFSPIEWVEAAQRIHWEYDSLRKYNPEFQGYADSGVTVKLPGATLLNYPLLWEIPNDNLRQNLKEYSSLPASVPSTSWAMLAIGYLETKQNKEAAVSFNNSYQKYVKQPFNTWMEYPDSSGPNSLSAAGGFLQVLLYGYGGLRIHLEYLYMNPQLPAGVHSMTFRDIDYLGSRFDVRITSVLMHISVHDIGIYPLRLVVGRTRKTFHMNRGTSIPVKRGAFTIRSKTKSGCPLPTDKILPYSSASSRYTSLPEPRTSGSSIAVLGVFILMTTLTLTTY